MTIDLNKENLAASIQKDGIVLIDWWASWCGPCRAFAPIFEKASHEHPDLTFGKVDTQAQPELAAAFGIRSIPTLMLFRDGVLLFNQPGMLPASALKELIAKARELDMDEVRADIARATDAENVSEPAPARASSTDAATSSPD